MRFFVYFFSFWLIACKNDEVKLAIYQDPFNDALRSHHVEKVILSGMLYGNRGDLATIFLSENGLYIRILGSLIDERFQYDSLLYLTSKYEGPDVYDRHLINYTDPRNGTMVQTWMESDTEDSVLRTQVLPVVKRILFKLDPFGNVVEESDSLRNERVVNEYNAYGRLSAKYIYAISQNNLKSVWRYNYVQNRHTLVSITRETANKEPMLTHYFTNGLPDSTKDHLDGYVTKYRYTFRKK